MTYIPFPVFRWFGVVDLKGCAGAGGEEDRGGGERQCLSVEHRAWYLLYNCSGIFFASV